MVAPKGTLDLNSTLVRRVRDLLREIEPAVSSTRMARVDALNRRKVLERREDLLALERRLDRFREVFGERPAVSLSESLEGVLALVQVEYLMDSVPHGVEAPGVET